jgi:hypothetical protein
MTRCAKAFRAPERWSYFGASDVVYRMEPPLESENTSWTPAPDS